MTPSRHKLSELEKMILLKLRHAEIPPTFAELKASTGQTLHQVVKAVERLTAMKLAKRNLRQARSLTITKSGKLEANKITGV